MEDLHRKPFEPCRMGDPLMTPEEIKVQRTNIPYWEIVDVSGVKKLHREFKFKNFQQALAFTNRLGEIAEKEDHHPSILTEWGRVCVTWWTHTVQGLHINDFIMAAMTDRLI